MIAARLLGPPLITIDGAAAPAELLWRKHLAVCVVLWNSAGMRASRERLIGLLWADKDEAAARHSLNEALRVIRKHVGAEALDSEDDTVRWLAPVDLDIETFLAIDAARPEEAAALIGGVFCEGFGIPEAPDFETWLATLRRDWTARALTILLRAVASSEHAGRIPEALAFAIRATELEPWSDEAARALIRARWLAGDRAASLADGRAFAARLARDLNTQPDARTKALIARVAAGRTPRIHDEHAPAARRPALFGRYQILSRTLTITRDVVAGRHPSLIVLSGESGSGRSRLLDEIVLRSTLEGGVVVTMRAVEADHEHPLALWLGLASGGLLDAPGVGNAPMGILAGVAAASADWADRFPVTRGATGLPLSDAVLGIIRAVANESPLLLAIDDAHRLGEKGLMRIPKLVRGLAGTPVTVLVTLDTGYPSSSADELRRSAERDTPGAAMRIDRWELGDLDQLVGWALPEWEESDRSRLARRLNAESDGRPALAVELLSAVIQGLPLEGDTGTWPIPGQSQPVDFPETLVAAVRLGFDRLPADEQLVLVTAALVPEPVTGAQVGQLTGLADVETVLDRLEWERWLVADGRGYSFPARAIRQLIADSLATPEQRRRITERMPATPG